MMRYKKLSWRHQHNQLEGVVQVGYNRLYCLCLLVSADHLSSVAIGV